MSRPVYQFVATSLALLFSVAFAEIPVGELIHDGPATPEQLSLLIPVTGNLTSDANAIVRFRKQGESAWRDGHPMHRILTNLVDPTPGLQDGFAWPIIELAPGQTYDVEVIVSDGLESVTKRGEFTTRSLPLSAGPATVSIPSGTGAIAIENAINQARPGDVIQIKSGEFALSKEIFVDLQGSEDAPIYIRGESRSGTIIRRDGGSVFTLGDGTAHVVFENLTLQGPGIDAGITPIAAIAGQSGEITSLTLRQVTIRGFDQAIVTAGEMQGALIYDNTMLGNNQWNQDLYAYGESGSPGSGDGTPDLHQNIFWNDDGIRLPGAGNAAFNNTIKGFGDAISFCHHRGGARLGDCRAIHFYRNEVIDAGDDGAEVDHAIRNVSLYDNRIVNGGAFVSVDPLSGGPLLAARNIGVNFSRTPYKQNATISGQFFYNNTVIVTSHRHVEQAGYSWVQFNDGALRGWGYRNNLYINHGSGRTFAIESSGNDPIDFTHNSWFPDNGFDWPNSGGGTGARLNQAYAAISPTTPLYSESMKRHEADNITEAQPFNKDIVLGSNHLTRIAITEVLKLRDGTAPRANGVAIANITDGFSGAAPDRGAVISGRAHVVYGDRSLRNESTVPRPPVILTTN